MVKHRNSISSGHFRKHWQKYVKTDFNRSSNKKIRRTKRKTKTTASKRYNFSPQQLLRPVVNNPTKMYNLKIRLGRGFSFSELDGSRVSKKDAFSIGVSIDKRRRGGSLKQYSNIKTLNDFLDKIGLVSKGTKSLFKNNLDSNRISTIKLSEMKNKKNFFPNTKINPKEIIFIDSKKYSAFEKLQSLH